MAHRRLAGAACLVVALFGAVGCQSIQDNPKTAIGGLGGAAAGGLMAAALGGGGAGIAAGVIGGGLLGGFLGNMLDDKDKTRQAQATQTALEKQPSGHSSAWTNPDNGHAGSVTPTPTYQNAQGQYCREFTQNVTIGGEQHQGYGTACRQPDGTWKIVN
jgi:surface antigen